MSILPEPEDNVYPGLETPVIANLVMSITRFGQEVINVEETIAPLTETIIDKNLPFGSSTVQQEGNKPANG